MIVSLDLDHRQILLVRRALRARRAQLNYDTSDPEVAAVDEAIAQISAWVDEKDVEWREQKATQLRAA